MHRLLPEVVARIGRAYGAGARCLLIVPEQYTLQAETEIVEGLRLPGYFDIDVLSPSRLRDRVFERAGQPQRVRIDERGKCMVLSAALEDLQDDLLFYRGAGGRTGFVQRLSALVADFKRGGLAPQDVAQLAGRTDGMLAMKLEDAGRVFAAYEARLAGSFVDGEDVQRELLARMEPSGVLAGAQVFIYGFDMITPTFAAQICAMARCAQELTLALTLDRAPARDAALYEPALRSLQRLEDLLREAGIPTGRERVAVPLNAPEDIAHLERELYAYPMRPMRAAPERVSLHAAATPFAEVHVAAARIRALAMEGMPFSRMAAVYTDGTVYAPLVERIFAQYDIPIYVSEKRPALSHPLFRFLLSSLRAVTRGYRVDDLMECVRTGYCGLTDEEADALDEYTGAYGVRAGRMRLPFAFGGEEELAQAEALRVRVVEPLTQLQSALSRARDAGGTVDAIFGYLQARGAFDTLQREQQALIAAGLDVEAADCAQVWNLLMELLDQMHTLLGGHRGRVRAVLDMLEAGVGAMELAALPTARDELIAGRVGNVRTARVDALFMLGMNDGRLQSADRGLLTDEERARASGEAKAYLGMSDADRAQLSRLDVLQAMSQPAQRLLVSYALSDEEGRALRPAPAVLALRRVFPDLPVTGGALDKGEHAALSSPRAALDALAVRLRGLADAGEPELSGPWREAYAVLCAQEAYAGRARDVRDALIARVGAARLRTETARRLYGRRTVSVSKLETFAQCPYRHFVGYGLRPVQRRETGAERDRLGELYHQAIERFTREALSQEAWPNVDRAQSDRMMDAVVEPLLEAWRRTPLGESARGRALAGRMRRTARRAGWTLTRQMQGSGFRPAEMELTFGSGGVPPVCIDLADGSRAYLRGRIDRIDLMETQQSVYLRVIDYKSGKRELDPTDVYWGLQLQLLIYLYAASHKYAGAQPAGLFYCRIDDPLITGNLRVQEQVEREIAKRLSLKGLSLSDVEIVRAQGEDQVRAMLKNDGTLRQGAAAVSSQELSLLVDYAVRMAAQLSARIAAGEIDVSPAQRGPMRACAYCDYRGICGFDPLLSGASARVLEKKSLDDVVRAQEET